MTSKQLSQVMYVNNRGYPINFFIRDDQYNEFLDHHKKLDNFVPNLIQNFMSNRFLPFHNHNHKINNLPINPFTLAKNQSSLNSTINEFSSPKNQPPPNLLINEFSTIKNQLPPNSKINNLPINNQFPAEQPENNNCSTVNHVSTDEFLNKINESFSPPEKLSTNIELCLTWLLHDSVINNLERFSILLNGVCYLPKKDQDKLAKISNNLVVELMKLPLKDDKISKSFDKYYLLKWDLRAALINCMDLNQLAIHQDPNSLPINIKSLLVKKNNYLLKELNELKEFINENPISIQLNDNEVANCKDENCLTKLEFDNQINKLKDLIHNLESNVDHKLVECKAKLEDSINELNKKIHRNYEYFIDRLSICDYTLSQRTFVWFIDFKRLIAGDALKSPIFYCKTIPWYLMAQIVTKNNEDYLSLHLASCFNERRAKYYHNVLFRAKCDLDVRIWSILDDNSYDIIKLASNQSISDGHLFFGWNYFANLEQIKNGRYIDQYGTIKVQSDLKVNELIRKESLRSKIDMISSLNDREMDSGSKTWR